MWCQKYWFAGQFRKGTDGKSIQGRVASQRTSPVGLTWNSPAVKSQRWDAYKLVGRTTLWFSTEMPSATSYEGKQMPGIFGAGFGRAGSLTYTQYSLAASTVTGRSHTNLAPSQRIGHSNAKPARGRGLSSFRPILTTIPDTTSCAMGLMYARLPAGRAISCRQSVPGVGEVRSLQAGSDVRQQAPRAPTSHRTIVSSSFAWRAIRRASLQTRARLRASCRTATSDLTAALPVGGDVPSGSRLGRRGA